MRFLTLIKVLALPLLLPISILYSLFVFFNRVLSRAYRSDTFVLSVGNLQVGGTGKTPIVIELIKQLKDKKLNPIIISKSYKATLVHPKEVLINDNAAEVGDEALLIKKTCSDVQVFSGPNKSVTLKFAEKTLEKTNNNIFILDDGAQHFKIEKDLKVIVWDGSRSIFDLFSFPLGFSRECLFLSESSHFKYINRSQKNMLTRFLKSIYGKEISSLDSEVFEVKNLLGETLSENAILISGIGNFDFLAKKVESYIKDQNLILKSKIKRSDHDSFIGVTMDANEIYICTEKDHDKLKDKVASDKLYVVKSNFSSESKQSLSNVAMCVMNKMGEP